MYTTQQMTRLSEMCILRSVSLKSRMDTMPNQEAMRKKDIVKFTKITLKAWNNF